MARGFLRRPSAFREYRDVSPLHGMQRGTVLNKAGRLVLQAKWGDRTVKIYETENSFHALFIEAVSGYPDLEGVFPKVFARHGAFVVAEWVEVAWWNRFFEGTRKDAMLGSLAAFQSRLHGVSPDDLPRPGFDYWNDLLWPRFARIAHLLRMAAVAHEVQDQVGAAWAGGTKTLMHPDLTPANVVRGSGRRWRIIDNELLTIGGLPLLDVCNTANALGREHAAAYVREYLERANLRLDPADLEVLRKAWMARVVGSAFVAGRVPKAEAVLKRYRTGQRVLPLGFGMRGTTSLGDPHPCC